MRKALFALLGLSSGMLLHGTAAHAQRLDGIKPLQSSANSAPFKGDVLKSGGSLLSLVTPLGGRISPVLTALYQNYVVLHPREAQLQLDALSGTLLKAGAQARTTSPVTTGAPVAAGTRTLATTSATLVNPAPVGVDYAALSKVGDTPIRVSGGRVLVNISVAGDVAMARQQLEALGMQVNGEFSHYLGGTLPIAALGQVAQLSNVVLANPDYGCRVNTGATTTQGDAVQRSALARSTYSVTGANRKVGVISDSFNKSGNGSYEADVASGDLPAASSSNTSKSGLTLLAERNGAGSDEGRAMLQIVSDVAPGAGLAFASGFNSYTQFSQNILDLRRVAACDVIVDDVFYYNEPFFQDGPVAQAVDTVVGAGAAYFSSAGNNARNSYESTFRPSAVTRTIGSVNYELHDFDPGAGVDTAQRITLPVGATFGCSFQWDDSFRSVAPSSAGAVTDLDIFLYTSGGTLVAQGSLNSVGNDPLEIFQYANTTNTTAFDVVIGRRSTTGGTPYIKYVDFANSIAVGEFATNSGTSVGHSNAINCESVGAVFWNRTPDYGFLPPQLEPFSSAGGVAIRRDIAGNFIGVKLRNTPDIVAPDGGNTTFFGQQLGEDAGTQYPNFFGTSAAAPHAAGVAALMLQANSSASPTQIYRSLERTALDMGATQGYDYDSGYGFINANAAIADITTASSATTGALISEFRERGSGGTSDEYVELYNPTSSALNISGWKLQYTGGGATQTLTVAANTSIPAYGHYLMVGSAYSLANYGGTNAAAGNQTFAIPIDDASPLTLLNSVSQVQDSITFSNANGGLASAPTVDGEYAFVRQYDTFTGLPIQGNNSFMFVATDGGTYTGNTNSFGTAQTLTAVLGAPGPKNLSSPVFTRGINVTLLDPSLSNSAAPNRVRNTGATGTNAINGTLAIRRMVTNNTGATITRLRFRIVNLTTLNSPGYTNTTQVDMRLIASANVTQSITVNGQPVTVYGTTPLEIPAQAAGGGVNSSSVETSSGVVTLSQSIPPGQSRAYDFTFGLARTGNFVVSLILESTIN